MSLDPKIPEPLKRSSPRPVRPTAAGFALLAAALGLGAAAIGIGAWLYDKASGDARWTAEVIHTEGEVLKVSPLQRNNKRKLLMFAYQAGAQKHIGGIPLRRQDEKRFAAGGRIAVRYSAVRPDKAWIEGYGPNITPVWLALALPLGLAAPALALWIFYHRQAQLLSEGRPAIATIIEAKKPFRGTAANFRVRYEFTALNGARRTGSYDVQKNPPQAGSRIVIVYDRDNPKRSVHYPALLSRFA